MASEKRSRRWYKHTHVHIFLTEHTNITVHRSHIVMCICRLRPNARMPGPLSTGPVAPAGTWRRRRWWRWLCAGQRVLVFVTVRRGRTLGSSNRETKQQRADNVHKYTRWTAYTWVIYFGLRVNERTCCIYKHTKNPLLGPENKSECACRNLMKINFMQVGCTFVAQ